MTTNSQLCPKCHSPYGYPEKSLWTCPECFHEWSVSETNEAEASPKLKFVDAVGNELQEGDTVTTTKDLRVGKDTIKSGTKAKNIKLLLEPINGHDISCKIPGFGQIYLKCSVVRKQG